jgi:polyhydroxybutyrate depolymerase
MTPTKQRRSILGTVLVLINLPVLLALVEAVVFYAHNRDNGAIISSGERRTYLLHVPSTYDRTRPTPLVISMHAAALWPAVQRDISQWDVVADEQGFIVVYPSGIDRGAPPVWRVNRGPGLEADVRFIADLIDTLQADYNIDPGRIYADGMSNGGGMAFALSCTLSDRIAAVGMVAPALTLPWNWCAEQRPVPMILFHGTEDRFTPYHGGWSRPTMRVFPDVPTFAANWARRNGCAESPSDSVVATDVTRRAYVNCAGDAPVEFYTIRGGGHSWPGGTRLPEWFVGPTSQSIDATRVIWKFFREHPLRTPN